MSKTFGELKVGDEVYVIKDNDVKICKVVDCARDTSDAIGFTCIALGNGEYCALPNDQTSFGNIYCDIDDAIRKMQYICDKTLQDYQKAMGALYILEIKKKIDEED